MPRQTVQIPVDEGYPEQRVARFLGTLAYPDVQEARTLYELAAGAIVLRRRAAEDPEWAFQLQEIMPALLLMEPRKAQRIVKACHEIVFSRRLLAAHMARSLFADEVCKQFNHGGLDQILGRKLGSPIPVPLKVTAQIDQFDPLSEKPVTCSYPVSVNRMAESLAQQLNQCGGSGYGRKATSWNRENVITRIWAPSKPVLHLAMAFSALLDDICGPSCINEIKIYEGEWVDKASFHAESLRSEIVRLERFRIEDADTILVEPNDRPA